MRTVIVEDVETAEAKKQRLATTAVDAALEILRTEASGLVIEAAAPLVFQGLCRRDNIRVEFTQTPMTNGRVIWVPSTSATSSRPSTSTDTDATNVIT